MLQTILLGDSSLNLFHQPTYWKDFNIQYSINIGVRLYENAELFTLHMISERGITSWSHWVKMISTSSLTGRENGTTAYTFWLVCLVRFDVLLRIKICKTTLIIINSLDDESRDIAYWLEIRKGYLFLIYQLEFMSRPVWTCTFIDRLYYGGTLCLFKWRSFNFISQLSLWGYNVVLRVFEYFLKKQLSLDKDNFVNVTSRVFENFLKSP